MNALDTSFLVDYLHGEEEVREFVAEHEHEPLFAPTVALFEVFVGAARTRGAEGIDEARDDLSWVNELGLSVESAAEAALVDAELHERGEPVGLADTLIAGIVRNAGGTLVTGDGHFENVSGLEVERYVQE